MPIHATFTAQFFDPAYAQDFPHRRCSIRRRNIHPIRSIASPPTAKSNHELENRPCFLLSRTFDPLKGPISETDTQSTRPMEAPLLRVKCSLQVRVPLKGPLDPSHPLGDCGGALGSTGECLDLS